MNFSLKPHPLIAHWFPGMVLLTLLVLSYSGWSYRAFKATYAATGPDATVTILLLSVAAFFIGEVIDSARDWLLERLFDWYATKRATDKVNWNFFFTSPPDKVEQFSDFFYTYYVLNINLVLALAIFVVMVVFSPISLPQRVLNLPGWAVGFGGCVCMAILFGDALALRRDVARITNRDTAVI